jgi:uncharacterized membrane protein
MGPEEIRRRVCVITTVPFAHTRSILIALVIWSFYVVVGRICAPAIQRQSAASWSRATGGEYIGFEEKHADGSAGTMVGYVVLWLLFAWSYLKVSQRDTIDGSLTSADARDRSGIREGGTLTSRAKAHVGGGPQDVSASGGALAPIHSIQPPQRFDGSPAATCATNSNATARYHARASTL